MNRQATGSFVDLSNIKADADLDSNLGSFGCGKHRRNPACVAEDHLDRLDRLARYHLREHREKSALYQQMFNLGAERRAQDVDCWRDVVHVMRDFLYAWEAHETAKSRAILLQGEGTA